MFHTQDEWRSNDGADVFRALSGEPTRQRFSMVEVFANAPTYEVKVAFLDFEGGQCWRKFLCSQLSKVVELVLGEDVVMAQVCVNSLGRVKNIALGEAILEIFQFTEGAEYPSFFFITSSGISISDDIDEISIEARDQARSIWRN